VKIRKTHQFWKSVNFKFCYCVVSFKETIFFYKLWVDKANINFAYFYRSPFASLFNYKKSMKLMYKLVGQWLVANESLFVHVHCVSRYKAVKLQVGFRRAAHPFPVSTYLFILSYTQNRTQQRTYDASFPTTPMR
jgi:hypothetical protein